MKVKTSSADCNPSAWRFQIPPADWPHWIIQSRLYSIARGVSTRSRWASQRRSSRTRPSVLSPVSSNCNCPRSSRETRMWSTHKRLARSLFVLSRCFHLRLSCCPTRHGIW
jgi:hypothetical protein